MGDVWGRLGTDQGDSWVWRGVVRGRGQETHKVKAAGVEAGGPSGSHHQDFLGVVV